VDALVRQTGGQLLADLALFDVYRGEQIGAGKKSLAYQLTYQHPERTLTDEEVAKLRERILKRLEQDLGAKQRA
jgi:phenylalanyl-tRNA synthetase beta chain